MPARARNTKAVDRWLSWWWAMADRGYRPDSAHGCQPDIGATFSAEGG
jgi:hypothetical protein